MRTFNSLEKFSDHLKKVVMKKVAYEEKWGEFCAKLLEKESKDKIGHLQEGWAPLADSTKKDKERLGYVFNADYNPLYREGDLRDSIKGVYNLSLHQILLGSFSEIMIYQALGTMHIPPRDPIGTTMAQAKPEIALYLGQMFVQWLLLKPFKPRRANYGNI